MTRVNTLEASASLVTTETKQALEAVNEINVKRDQQLRDELNSSAKKLETGFAALETTATSAQAAPSTEGFDLVRRSTAVDGLQDNMLEWTERTQAQLDATSKRAEGIAVASNMVHQEAQMQFQTVNGKLNELSAVYQSSGPAPAPTSQPQSAVDPMAGGNEDWLRYLGKGGASPSVFASPSAFGSHAQRVSIATPFTFDPPRVNGR